MVKYSKDMLETPRKVKNFTDVVVSEDSDGSQRFIPQTDSEPFGLLV